MGIRDQAVGFIRSIFRREAKAREAASAGFSPGEFAYDMHGNYALHTLGYNTLADQLQVDTQLMARYVDYERMDEYAECSSALSIYSDDSTVMDPQKKHVCWVECKDAQIQDTLNQMLWKKLDVDGEAWEIIRQLCKYGNSSDEILVDDKGVQGLNFIPSPTLRRIEDKTGMTKAFIQSFRGHFSVPTQTFGDIEFEKGVGKDQGTGVVIFEPWRVVHMRLRAQRRRAQYGLGLLESARHIWKRLILLEDAALIGRLSRAPSRFAFYVDVGRMAPQQAEKYMEATRQQFKKQKFVNPKTGQLDLKFSPLSIDNDLFLPVRDSKEVVRADVLNTPQWTGVEDIEYFRSKLFAALLVPKSYLGYDENLPGRSTLSAEDVRFARSVLRIQREFRKGMRQICDVHLAAIGIDPAYIDYDVKMTIPSSIFELAQLEVQNTRAQFAQQMRELVSEHWILSTIFGLSDEEIKIIYEQKKQEMKDRMGMEGGEGGGGGGRFEGREPSRVITPTDIEQRLFNGNRDHEKRLEKDMERVLAENQHLSSQLGELRGLLNDVRSAVRYTNGSSHKGAFGM
jgi:hypothetical protein